jgi:hypothetical protein
MPNNPFLRRDVLQQMREPIAMLQTIAHAAAMRCSAEEKAAADAAMKLIDQVYPDLSAAASIVWTAGGEEYGAHEDEEDGGAYPSSAHPATAPPKTPVHHVDRA